MPTPADIRQHTFTIARRGFDQVEVTEFLQKMSEQIEALQAELGAMHAEAMTSGAALASAKAAHPAAGGAPSTRRRLVAVAGRDG
jgi:DivIVA domain-containing protein